MSPPYLYSPISTVLIRQSFETKGIVALVFSVIAGIIGVIVVAWFGLSSHNSAEPARRDSTVLATSDSGASGGVVEETTAGSKATGGNAVRSDN